MQNVAETVVSNCNVNEQAVLVPEQIPPPQPRKTEPAEGVSVKVIAVPLASETPQAGKFGVQLIPPGEDVIDPVAQSPFAASVAMVKE